MNLLPASGTHRDRDREDHDLDLVCVYPEAGINDRYKAFHALMVLPVVGSLMILCLVLVFGLCVAAFSFNWQAVMTSAVFFFLICPLWGAFFIKFKSSFPTNLLCRQSDFKLAWKTDSYQKSPPILWRSVIGASIYNYETNKKSFPYLVFDIDLSCYRLIERSFLIYQTKALWFDRYPVHKRASGAGYALSLAFPLHSFTLESDKLRLLSYLKERLDASVLNDNLLTMGADKNVPTYTQLWLDDMRSFRRARIGALEPGAHLKDDCFVIDSLRATGGQARIYRGTDTAGNKKVVLKEFVLPTNAGADVRNNSFASIKNEANFLSTLNHPGIVRLLDHFVEDHRAYLVLDFIEGETLRNLVKMQGPQPESLAAAVCVSICDLCIYLHNQTPPVVHRDLAPDNLILTPEGEVKLIDFSVAQHFEADRTKTVCGKHNYMAPEQFKGMPSTQSDLYSLGGTIYYLLTGNDPTPLTCLTLPAVLSGSVSDSASKKMSDVISKLTKLDPAERYQSAEDVLRDLKDLAPPPT